MIFVIIFATSFSTPISKADQLTMEKLISMVDIKTAKQETKTIISDELPHRTLEDFFSMRNIFSPSLSNERTEIESAVKFASNATGVRKDFLMGMLMVESNLGKNTGQCSYGDIEQDAKKAYAQGNLSKRSWENFLERSRIFKSIAQDLHYQYKTLRVSCTPARYAGTGGAMGVPQFMPDTWLEYKDRIAQISGKKNPDPWNVRDGVVAMAVKLSDVRGVTQHNILAERNAAKMYLSGSTSNKYEWYANQIMYWAQNYEKIDV